MKLRCQSSVCIFHREKKRKEISVFSFESAVHLIRYLRLNLQNLCSALSLPTGMLNRYTAHHPTSPKDKVCYQNVSSKEMQSDPKWSATAIWSQSMWSQIHISFKSTKKKGKQIIKIANVRKLQWIWVCMNISDSIFLFLMSS